MVAARAAGLPPGRSRRPAPRSAAASRTALRSAARVCSAASPAVWLSRWRIVIACLPFCAELRPVARHGRVDVELAALDQDVRAERRHRLGGRKDVDDRVALPGPRARRIGVAAPQIDDRLAVDAWRRTTRRPRARRRSWPRRPRALRRSAAHSRRRSACRDLTTKAPTTQSASGHAATPGLCVVVSLWSNPAAWVLSTPSNGKPACSSRCATRRPSASCAACTA